MSIKIHVFLTGVYCLFTPAMTYMTLGYVVGINMILDAIGSIVLWHERKKLGDADGWALAGTIASLVFGTILTASTAMQWIVDMAVVYLAAIGYQKVCPRDESLNRPHGLYGLGRCSILNLS